MDLVKLKESGFNGEFTLKQLESIELILIKENHINVDYLFSFKQIRSSRLIYLLIKRKPDLILELEENLVTDELIRLALSKQPRLIKDLPNIKKEIKREVVMKDPSLFFYYNEEQDHELCKYCVEVYPRNIILVKTLTDDLIDLALSFEHLLKYLGDRQTEELVIKHFRKLSLNGCGYYDTIISLNQVNEIKIPITESIVLTWVEVNLQRRFVDISALELLLTKCCTSEIVNMIFKDVRLVNLNIIKIINDNGLLTDEHLQIIIKKLDIFNRYDLVEKELIEIFLSASRKTMFLAIDNGLNKHRNALKNILTLLFKIK